MKKYLFIYSIVTTIISLLSIYLNYNLYSIIELFDSEINELLLQNKKINEKLDLNIIPSDPSIPSIDSTDKNNHYYLYTCICLIDIISIVGISLYYSDFSSIQNDISNNIINTIADIREIPINHNNNLLNILYNLRDNLDHNNE